VLVLEQLSFIGGKCTHLVYKGYVITMAAWICAGPNSRIVRLCTRLDAPIDWVTIHEIGSPEDEWVVTRGGRRFSSLDAMQHVTSERGGGTLALVLEWIRSLTPNWSGGAHMVLNRAEYRGKLLGCWLGKNIGGTLGAPFEWRRQINNVRFYSQELRGEPLPNDDLDIQLLWLVALEEQGVGVDAHILGEYFLHFVTPYWVEYGMAKVNMASGLHPPLSGMVNNPYKHSCGAFIRSEIWACIAPGCPELAARFAYQDAIIDHGDGEGTFAEVFTAAMESAAFFVQDVRKLIDIGLSFIPSYCGVAGAVQNAIASYEGGKTWREARDALLEGFRGSSHHNDPRRTSPEDREKGFHEGVQGWDAPSNIGIIVLGLLYGEGDFERTLCTTVNCGEDTDCTGATVGSLYGILNGADAIPGQWIEPIGRRIRTACLDLGDLGFYGNQLPATVDELTDRTERVARQVILRYGLPLEIADDQRTHVSETIAESLLAADEGAFITADLGCPVYRFGFFDVAVDYDGDPSIRDGVPKSVGLTIRNRYKFMENLGLHWYLPEGWRVHPSANAQVYVPNAAMGRPETRLSFAVETDVVQRPVNRCIVELATSARPTVLNVPIVLLNGNASAPIVDLDDLYDRVGGVVLSS